MRALQVTSEDGPDSVALADLPEPDGDFVIAVRAAGVTFPDLLMTRGEYQLRQPLPFILGWEAAGEVLRAPADSGFAVGDRVVTLNFGAHAEQVAATPETTFALADELSFEEGAALPLNYLTALAALDRRGGLRAGETSARAWRGWGGGHRDGADREGARRRGHRRGLHGGEGRSRAQGGSRLDDRR